MSGWGKKYRDIKDKFVGRTGKRVFLVEGTDDLTPYHLLFTKKFGSDWEQSWVIADAGKKNHVLEMLKEEPTWLGLVDRDEWGHLQIEKEQEVSKNLLVLPRYCMESYLFQPDELWAVLTEEERAKFTGGHDDLSHVIYRNLDQWVRHGVLWSVINPMWPGIRSIGFNDLLRDVNNAQDDEFIKKILKEWHDYLNPDGIFDSFIKRLDLVTQQPKDMQLKLWVHGKQFWNKDVHPALNSYLGQEKEPLRRQRFWQGRDVPQDWDPIWERITE